ncbi:putative phosphomevalonate kinase [Zancudomyces culisetae]|uniref:phosphomevalonate kinase n=1 Tax=Zancudomyces culisetae TaxID=1213189 RepID=A0A1R1PBY4_ZANCU|nr:putative phosphomevalonate kinase [Zancudomyces culisetae]|eukprot:OMH78478.1 putative phosphomevalonate kinase [Zancudomyces culisetae]
MKADINSIKGDDNSFKISVNSVQFNEAEWVYTSRVIKPNDSTQNLALDFEFDGEDENKNKFVEATLKNTLRIALIKNQQAIQKLIDENQNLRVNIGTDNDFYTQRSKLEELGLEITTESLKKLPKMEHTNTTLEKVNKTGLGSSAAMVTSLVGAVLAYFGVIGVKNRELSEEDKQLVHNISQLSHCSAQGKIGSGFDVSAAVYGTHIYRRFSPSVIEQAMELSAEQAEKLLEVVDPKNKKFNSVVQKINLPPGTMLRLADIQAGSNTPSMVSKVLKWRKDHEKEAQQLWNSIDEYNQSVVEVWHELNKLCLQDRDGYYSALSKCSLLAARCWNKDICANGSATDDSVEMNTVVALGKLYATSLAIRRLMREMGERCGVPIEPQSQTQLLDRCLDSPGVCMAGVPGG